MAFVSSNEMLWQELSLVHCKCSIYSCFTAFIALIIVIFYYWCISKSHRNRCSADLSGLRPCQSPQTWRDSHPWCSVAHVFPLFTPTSAGWSLGKNIMHTLAVKSDIHLCTELRALMWAEKRIFLHRNKCVYELKDFKRRSKVGLVTKNVFDIRGTVSAY
jgi:hypothetical protein